MAATLSLNCILWSCKGEMKRNAHSDQPLRYDHRDVFRIRCGRWWREPGRLTVHRGEPMPDIKDAYDTEAEAEKQPRCRITTTGLRPNAVNGNGGDGELHHFASTASAKKVSAQSPMKMPKRSACAFLQRFPFLNVPDENRANYGYESKCREND